MFGRKFQNILPHLHASPVTVIEKFEVSPGDKDNKKGLDNPRTSCQRDHRSHKVTIKLIASMDHDAPHVHAACRGARQCWLRRSAVRSKVQARTEGELRGHDAWIDPHLGNTKSLFETETGVGRCRASCQTQFVP